jgi:hypothetical protein
MRTALVKSANELARCANLAPTSTREECLDGGERLRDSRRRLTAHFMMNVPTGRSINPVTKTDWEGAGVVPDIAVPAKKALVAGQESLLKKLLAGENDPERRRRLNDCLEELR